MKHQSKFTPKPKEEVKEIVIDPEFEAVISGPYEEEAPPVKPVGLRLTTPTCPPVPEELESKIQEVLANSSGEVVASWRLEPHSCVFVTWPSGQKHTIPR